MEMEMMRCGGRYKYGWDGAEKRGREPEMWMWMCK